MDGPEAPLSAAKEPSCRAAHEETPEQQSAYAEADETWCEDLATPVSDSAITTAAFSRLRRRISAPTPTATL